MTPTARARFFRDLLDRVTIVEDAEPELPPDITHMLTIAQRRDGTILLGAATEAPVEAFAFFRVLLMALTADATALALVAQACGIKGALYEATGIPPRRVDDDEAA